MRPLAVAIVVLTGREPIHLWFQSADMLWRLSGAVLERDGRARDESHLHAELHDAYEAIMRQLVIIDWVAKTPFPHAR